MGESPVSSSAQNLRRKQPSSLLNDTRQTLGTASAKTLRQNPSPESNRNEINVCRQSLTLGSSRGAHVWPDQCLPAQWSSNRLVPPCPRTQSIWLHDVPD